MTPPVY